MQTTTDIKALLSLEQIIFDLNENKVDQSVETSIDFYNEETPYSFSLIISKLVYSCFLSHNKNVNTFFSYLNYLKQN